MLRWVTRLATAAPSVPLGFVKGFVGALGFLASVRRKYVQPCIKWKSGNEGGAQQMDERSGKMADEKGKS